MAGHLQIVSTVASLALLLVVLDLVRRRRLFERYAILWLLSAIVLTGLSVWSGALDIVSRAVGIKYPPSTLFLAALGFVLLLLLHFSVAVSRLSDQSKVLAQRLALVEERLRELGGRTTAEPEAERTQGVRPAAQPAAAEQEPEPVGTAAAPRAVGARRRGL